MIITPTITDETGTVVQNFLRQAIINETMKGDNFSLHNWDGIFLTDTGAFASPLSNTIIVHKTLIANDVYFVTGEIQYLYVYPGDSTTRWIKDGFFASCRVGKIDTLSAWHINLGLMNQNIYDNSGAVSPAPEIPQSDVTKKGGYRGIDVRSGTAYGYTDATSGTSGTTQGVFVHTVGGVTITNAAGTKIPEAISSSGATNPQPSYAVHDQWYAIPLDGVADGTLLDADIIGSEINTLFGASANWNLINYKVWGELAVIKVATTSQTGLLVETPGAVRIASTYLPYQVLFGTNCSDMLMMNFTNSPLTGGTIGGTSPQTNGSNPYFYYDISLTSSPTVDSTHAASGPYAILVGSGTIYETGVASRGELGFISAQTTNVLVGFGAGRGYSFGLTPVTYPSNVSPISLQSQDTAAEQNSTDGVLDSYFSHVQNLSWEQDDTEMIVLRLFSPGFVGGGYSNLTHVSYYYTNLSLLNSDLGNITYNIAMKQIGPLISCDTVDKTWNPAGLYSEARGFQNTSLSNGAIFGNKIGRPISDNLHNTRTATVDNLPKYSQDIRGFIGSYSPTNSADAAYETVVPYILAYDTTNSDTIIPNYTTAQAGTWGITATSSCFVTCSDNLTTYLSNSTPTTPSEYLQGGIMDANYDVVRNQWVLSLSANRDGVTFNNPAVFVAGDSNLDRFSYFKKDGIYTPVLAQLDATTSGGQAQSTSFLYVATAGNTDKFKAYTLGGNFTASADGVGGTVNNPFADPPTAGASGPIQLTQMEGVSGRSVIMWVDYILFDGLDSMIATKVQEMGLRVTIENVEWYKRKLLNNDELNITADEIEHWVDQQQTEYKDMLIRKEREGRLRKRRKQQSNIAHDLEDTIEGQFLDTTVYDFLDDDFIERNIKNLSAFPDQDESLKHQIITDEQFNDLDSLYGTPVPKKETVGEKLQKKLKTPKKVNNKEKDDAE